MSLSRSAGVLGFALASLALAVGAPASAPARCAGPGVRVQSSDADLARASLCLVNRERRRRGLRPLQASGKLSLAARRHASDMLRHGYFGHQSRSGASFVRRIRSTGYLHGARAWLVGENIALGRGRSATARAIVRAWMHSPPHRASILRPTFRELGAGVASSASRRGGRKVIYVQEFGVVRR